MQFYYYFYLMTDIPLLIHQSRSRIQPCEAVVWRLPHSPLFSFLGSYSWRPRCWQGMRRHLAKLGGALLGCLGAVLAVSELEEGLAPAATLAQKLPILFFLSKMLLGAHYDKPTSTSWKHSSISKMFYRNLLTFYTVQSDWATCETSQWNPK